MSKDVSRREYFLRVSIIIAVVTIFLTASFVGVLALLSGEIQGFVGRVPWYFVATAIAFVGAIILLEEQGASGGSIITTAFIVAVVVFTIVSLGVEGMVFAYEKPNLVFVSQIFLYFFAAALIGTGIGFWALRHWREFTGRPDGGL